jgi:MSHA pilin protein MshC
MSIEQYKRFSGFSLIELITVIVLLGILSVFALGRLSSPDQFAVKGFYNDTVNAMRFAQKLAVSTGCDVQVKMTAAGYQLRRSSTCILDDYATAAGVVVDNPANRSNPYENLATGFSVSPVNSIVFNALGVLDSGDNFTYTVTGGGTSFDFTVFGQTGLVNVP